MPIGTFAGFAQAALSALPGLLTGGAVVPAAAGQAGGGLGSVLGASLEGLAAFGASAGAVTPQMTQLGRVVRELAGQFREMKQASTGGWLTPASGPTLTPTGAFVAQMQPLVKGLFDRLLTPTPGQLGYHYSAIAGRWLPAGPGAWLTSGAMAAAQAAARAAGPTAPAFVARRLTSLLGRAHHVLMPLAASAASSAWARRILGRAAAGRAHGWLSSMSGMAANRQFRRAVGPRVANWVNAVVSRAQAHLTPIPARKAAVNWIAVGTSIAKGMAVAGLVASTVRTTGAIAESQNAENRRLAAYSPAIAGAYAMQNLADFQRNVRLGQAVQETARELAESVTRMRDSWSEFDQWKNRQWNRLGSFGAGFSSVFGTLASNAAAAASGAASAATGFLGNWMPTSYQAGGAMGVLTTSALTALLGSRVAGPVGGVAGFLAGLGLSSWTLWQNFQAPPKTTSDPGGNTAWSIGMAPLIPTRGRPAPMPNWLPGPRAMPAWNALPGMP